MTEPKVKFWEFRDKDVEGVVYGVKDINTDEVVGWQCAKCDYFNESWNSVIGHSAKHSTPKQVSARRKTRKGLMKNGDVYDMTIVELLDTVVTLREALADSEQKRREDAALLNRLRKFFDSDAGLSQT